MAQVGLRIPDNLKEAIACEAERMGFSFNAFVLQIFWDWYKVYQRDV